MNHRRLIIRTSDNSRQLTADTTISLATVPSPSGSQSPRVWKTWKFSANGTFEETYTLSAHLISALQAYAHTNIDGSDITQQFSRGLFQENGVEKPLDIARLNGDAIYQLYTGHGGEPVLERQVPRSPIHHAPPSRILIPAKPKFPESISMFPSSPPAVISSPVFLSPLRTPPASPPFLLRTPSSIGSPEFLSPLRTPTE